MYSVTLNNRTKKWWRLCVKEHMDYFHDRASKVFPNGLGGNNWCFITRDRKPHFNEIEILKWCRQGYSKYGSLFARFPFEQEKLALNRANLKWRLNLFKRNLYKPSEITEGSRLMIETGCTNGKYELKKLKENKKIDQS